MAGPPFSGRLVGKGIRAPSLSYAIGLSGRMLLLAVAAPIVAFGIAFAAGAATVTKPAADAQLVPSTRSAKSHVRLLAVTPVAATPDLKVPLERPAATDRSTAKPAPGTVVPVRIAEPVTHAVVPRGGSSQNSGGGSGATAVGTRTTSGSTAKTGTSSGGDSGSGGGTGTVSGGG
jgi:hypothetical protein